MSETAETYHADFLTGADFGVKEGREDGETTAEPSTSADALQTARGTTHIEAASVDEIVSGMAKTNRSCARAWVEYPPCCSVPSGQRQL